MHRGCYIKSSLARHCHNITSSPLTGQSSQGVTHGTWRWLEKYNVYKPKYPYPTTHLVASFPATCSSVLLDAPPSNLLWHVSHDDWAWPLFVSHPVNPTAPPKTCVVPRHYFLTFSCSLEKACTTPSSPLANTCNLKQSLLIGRDAGKIPSLPEMLGGYHA